MHPEIQFREMKPFFKIAILVIVSFLGSHGTDGITAMEYWYTCNTPVIGSDNDEIVLGDVNGDGAVDVAYIGTAISTMADGTIL